MNYQSIQLQIPNDKGLKLATEIYKPELEGKLPVIFLFHGFCGYREAVDAVDLAHRLSTHGFVTVRFTTAGFGDSDGTIEDDYRFSQHRRDADTIYTHVLKFPYIDNKKIGVCGHSMGGRLTVLFSNDHPAVRALCAISAPVSFSGTMYESSRPAWEKDGYLERVSSREQKKMHIPYAYYVDQASALHDTVRAAESLTVPSAMVIAGDADTEVPWGETKKIFDALNCPKEFLLLPGIEHRYKYRAKTLPTVHEPIVSFFQKHL